MNATLPKELLDSLLVRFDARRQQAVALIDAFFAHPDAEHLDAVLQSSHKLAGIAATLGFVEIGVAAAAVEKLAPAMPVDLASHAQLGKLRTALVEAVRQPSSEGESQ